MDLIEIILSAIPGFLSSIAEIVVTATPAVKATGVFVTGMTMFLLLFMMEADA